MDVEVRRWNESFYRSDPADHLLTRLQLLVLAGGRHQELADLFLDGATCAGFTISPRRERAAEEPDAPQEPLTDFVTIESQQLLHHASETVIRLFLVHGSATNVPWIELNATRSFSKVKERVRREIVDQSPDRDLVAVTLLGSATPADGTAVDEWNDAVDGLIEFLRKFATTWLDDAPIYNAIKHGLGVTAGDAVALIGNMQMGGGPSVEFPEPGERDPDGARSWRLTTRWVDIGESLGLIHVAAQMVASMWLIGKARHLGGPAQGQVFFPARLRPMNLRSPGRLPMMKMSFGELVQEADR